MITPERGFDANLARNLTKHENEAKDRLKQEDGSGPREIQRPAEPELTEAQRHALVDTYIDQTEQFLERSVATATEANKKVMERLGQNDIYSAMFRDAWDKMIEQQPYLASLEQYAAAAVRANGGTSEQGTRMEVVRKKVADAATWLKETTETTAKMMIDGGFTTRYRPQKQEQMIAASEDETVKKWGSMIGKKELPSEKAISHATTQEQAPVAPKKKSFWKRLFGRE